MRLHCEVANGLDRCVYNHMTVTCLNMYKHGVALCVFLF